MHRYHGIICAMISGLLLLCGFGARVYAADPCLTEVLPEDTKAHVVFTDMTLDYQVKKGEALTDIPQESVNEEGTALAKDFAFTLPTTKPEGNHKLKKQLEVQAQNGQRFRLQDIQIFATLSLK